MEARLREAGVPLFSLETKHPLRDFDLIGFTIPYAYVRADCLKDAIRAYQRAEELLEG